MKRTGIGLWLLVLMVMLAGSVTARIINIEVTVREKHAEGDDLYTLIDKQQLAVTEGIKTTAFITNFTLDLTAAYDDSGFFNCEFAVFTLGPQAQTFFKKFQSQPGGIYFLDGVRGKNDVTYRVGLSAISVDSSVGDGDCDYDFRADNVWRYDPSAHFDFYFVPQSLADARWNMLRDFVEINYKDFKELFQLTFPGKVNYFLSPCVLPQVIWDRRMGFAIDPPRSNCFALYSHDHNTIDPIPGFLVRIYRFMGYAPPLLAEGMAGYFEFPHYYARQVHREGGLPPLSMMLKAVDYYSLPGHTNFTVAASFVRYLIDNYGFGRFKRLYEGASDLSIGGRFDAVYGKPLDSLEAEWHAVLDTITFPYGQYIYHYEREKYIYRRQGMDMFLGEMRRLAPTRQDTIRVLTEEGWSTYMGGEYEQARADYEQLMQLEPANNSHLLIYANLLLLDGQYDSSRVMYRRVLEADSTIKTALYKIGEGFYWENRLDSAMYYFERDLAEDRSQLSHSSAGLLMGELALAWGDTAEAREYYSVALADVEQIYQYGKTRPGYLLRLGQAHLGLAMCGEPSLETAKSFLESALYFEVYPIRVIFMTRILRELGRIADLEGNREKAIGYYRKALTYPLPPAFEAKMRRYITEPFTGFAP